MGATDRLTDAISHRSAPAERGDAARNRLLLLDAARRLIADHGTDAVTMDAVAAAAGVGKGTLFRRFGSRAGLMLVLLDEDEKAEQQAFMFGPAPLGPGAPPLERLIAYGRERLRFVGSHRALLSDAGRDPQTRFNPPATLHRSHVRMLLASAGTTGDLAAQADALTALLDADYVTHQVTDIDRSTGGAGRCVGVVGPQALRVVKMMTALDPARRPRPVPRRRSSCGAVPNSRTAGDRRRQRRSDRAAQGRHVRLLRGAGVRRARGHAAAHRRATLPGAVFLPSDPPAYDGRPSR